MQNICFLTLQTKYQGGRNDFKVEYEKMENECEIGI